MQPPTAVSKAATQLFHEQDNLQRSFLTSISTPGRPSADRQAKANCSPAPYEAQTGLKSTTSYSLLRTRNRYTPPTSSPCDIKHR